MASVSLGKLCLSLVPSRVRDAFEGGGGQRVSMVGAAWRFAGLIWGERRNASWSTFGESSQSQTKVGWLIALSEGWMRARQSERKKYSRDVKSRDGDGVRNAIENAVHFPRMQGIGLHIAHWTISYPPKERIPMDPTAASPERYSLGVRKGVLQPCLTKKPDSELTIPIRRFRFRSRRRVGSPRCGSGNTP
ncbi:hypothetical protein BC826DRAFT_985132 [Russula brevipes]|nr:hypothetical protein BC826DRAFT_985132 [Russula brevipes]